MQKLKVLLVCALLTIVSFFMFSPGEAVTRSMEEEPGNPTRELQEGGTSMELLPSDSSVMEYSMNLSSYQGKAWELERNMLVEEEHTASSPPAGAPICGSRSMISYGSSYFTAFTRGTDTYLSFWITRYDGDLDRWEEPVMVENFTEEVTGRPELVLLDDELFYIMPLVSNDPSTSRILTASTTVERWYWMSNSTIRRVDDAGGIDGKVGSSVWGATIVVFWTEQENGELHRSEWKEGVWSEPRSVMSDVGIFAVNRYSRSNRLMLSHTDSDGSGINISSSVTGGVTWSEDSAVAENMEGITSLSTASHGPNYYLNAVSTSEMRSSLFSSSDGLSWTDPGPDILLTGSAPDGNFEGQVSADRSQVVIALENNGSVEVHSSTDGGRTFQLMEDLAQGTEDPLQSIDKGLIGVFKGGVLVLYRFRESTEGRIVTRPLSPLGLKSWDDVGLDLVGNVPTTFAGLRIWDRGMASQLYPQAGWLNLSQIGGGKVNGRPFSNVLDLSGGWTSGEGIATSIRLELKLRGSAEGSPAVSRIRLNYTTGFPFTSGLEHSENIVSSVNCSSTGNGYILDDGTTQGEIVIGPVESEGDWCEVISFRTSSLTSRVAYRVELLDRYLQPMEGFEEESSLVFTGSSVNGYARWGGNYLADMPATVNIINVRITIESEVANGRSVIESITFGDSAAPTLVSAEVDRTEVLRGEGATFEVVVSDRESPMDQLQVIMEHRGPDGGEWTGDMFKGQIMDDGVWETPFVTEYGSDPGMYDIRITVIDPMGDSYTETLETIMEVRNNPPVKPVAYIDSDRISSGDAVSVVIYKPGDDLETPRDELSYLVEAYRDGTLYDRSEGFTSETYGIPENTVEKGEVWNIGISTLDGIDRSQPFNLSFEVQNSPPAVSGAPTNLTLQEDSVSPSITLNSWFSDHDEDGLEFEVETGPGLGVQGSGGSIALLPDADFNGRSHMTVTASDGDLTAKHFAEVIVEPSNDPPVLRTMGDVIVEQDQTLEYYICAFDIVDREPVSVEIDIHNRIPGTVPGENLLVMDNGSFILNATNEMIGEFRITVTADDGTEQVSSGFNITVVNMNDPPTRPEISVDPDIRLFVGDGYVSMSANSSDPDLPWGDELNYIWTSDIQGELGEGKEIQTTLQEGYHVITVEVTDRNGSFSSAEVEIEVTGKLKTTEGTLSTSDLIKISLGTGALIGIVIAALTAIMMIRRRNARSEKEEESSSPDNKEEKEKPSGDDEKNGKPPSDKDTGGGDKDE